MFKRVLKTIGMCVAAMAVAVAANLLGTIASELLSGLGVSEIIGTAVASVLYPLISFIGIKLIGQKAFKYDLKTFRIVKPGIKLYWLAAALILPLAVTAFYQFSDGTWTMCANSSVIPVAAYGILFRGLAAGISEELVFRGAIMGTIEKEWNTKAAVLIPSIAFGAVHIMGRSLDLISIALLMAAGTLVGVMFSLIEIQSGSFWNNALVHAAWNIVILGLLHTDTRACEDSVFTYILKSKSLLLTGGDFGIEASLVAVIAYLIVIIIATVLMANNKAQSKVVRGTC
ncbi:hypothetical protein SAMN06296952_2053 [Oscillospiraceae bacterium]|nr:hypothetical protein SAMN06296952_2053 [Oscillospiraceae bacterium]